MTSAADSGRIVLQGEGKVTIIQIYNPKEKNVMTPEMSREFVQKLEEARIAEDIGAIIITGTGAHFCSGAHVGRVVSKVSEMTAAQWTASRGRGGGSGLYDMPKPTIAAINGSCVGAGFSMALDCDIRIAAVDARLRVGFRRVGLIPSANICFLKRP